LTPPTFATADFRSAAPQRGVRFLLAASDHPPIDDPGIAVYIEIAGTKSPLKV
jgi:hypothetical protein